ncbi:hypothetical protein BGZ63DRAFT_426849 [Mariannaea sp. PMI_226]|nr:hypothetical protein BGZ63DRAFT_426849 [Mariannaea sp. PMI_226]
MAEYSSLKVPELKKLLATKGLAQTGNKADLIARLQENDKKAATDDAADNKEDEISYSDDEAPAAPAAPAEEPAKEAPVQEAPAAAAAEPAQEATAEKPAETEEKPAEPAQSYAMGLASTAADEEAKKRAERAKRFGIEEDDDAKRRADRAKRFGLDEKELATSLDSALPERSQRRGRPRGQENDNRNRRQNRDRRNGDGRRGGRGVGRRDAPRRNILDDPTEKAKAEKRAARFAGN